MVSPQLQYAMQLLSQSRYDLAESAVRQVLGTDPDNATAHALLALCYVGLKEFAKAMQEAEMAIGLAPDNSFAYYVQSQVYVARNCFPEAETAIREALQLDPNHSIYWAQLAAIYVERRQWSEVIVAAEQGLNWDPENETCLNLRAIALRRLGRGGEADESIHAALQRNPEDSDSHANMGWSLLEKSQPKEALEHFREALRLEPESEWARRGIVEAMKARYFLYRIVLGWFLWMLRLPSRTQWGILIGAFVGYQVLRNLAAGQPQLKPFVAPLLIAYVSFALMTWLAAPLFNLFLRLNRFGRLALTREQTITSNWVGLCVLVAVLSLIGYFVLGDGIWLLCAAACALMIPPLANIYSCDVGWPRIALTLISIALGLLGTLVIGTLLADRWIPPSFEPAMIALSDLAANTFILSALITQFGVNALVSVRPRQGTITNQRAWLIGVGALVAAIVLFGMVASSRMRAATNDVATPKLFTLPIRAKAVRLEGELMTQFTWPQMKQQSNTLVAKGFIEYGRVKLEGYSRSDSWVLYQPELNCIADFTEMPKNELLCEITTRYDDGRFVTFSNSSNSGEIGPVRISTEYVAGASAVELFDRAMQERPQEGMTPVTEQSVVAFLEESDALYIDLLLERRGPTQDELRAIGAMQGVELSDRRIAQLQAIWRQQAGDAVDAFVLERFLKNPPEGVAVTNADRDRLICVHCLLSADAIRDFCLKKVPADCLPADAEKQVDAVLGRIASPRDAFAKIVEFIPCIKKLGTVSETIPTDVYRIER